MTPPPSIAISSGSIIFHNPFTTIPIPPMRDRGLPNEGPGLLTKSRSLPQGTEVYPDGPIFFKWDRGWHHSVSLNRYTGNNLPIIRLLTPLVPSSCLLCGPLISGTFDSLEGRSTTFEKHFTTMSLGNFVNRFQAHQSHSSHVLFLRFRHGLHLCNFLR